MSGSGSKVDECSGLPLIEGNPLLDALLSASEHIVYRLDFVRGGYDFISPRAATELGVPLAELHARGVQLLREFLSEEDRERCFAQLAALCAAAPGRAQSVCLEYRLRNAAGKFVCYSDSMTVLSDAAGRLLSTCGIAVDITQRREQERALRESEEKYRATMNASQVGVFILQDYKFRYVNPTLLSMFAYREDEVVDKLGPLDLVVPEQRDLLVEKMRQRAAGEAGAPYELTGLRKDGTHLPIMILGQPSLLAGRPASVGTVFDLSRQRQAEQALKDTSNRYAALFEGAQDAILVADVETGLIVDANVEAELLFLRPREELIGLNHLDVLPPALAQRYHDDFVRHVRAGGGGPDEMVILTADGDTIVVEASSNVIETASGRRLIQGVFRDIRQRKRVETELKLAARVFESSQEAIIITDAAGRIVSVNPAFSAMTGFAAVEVIGKNPRILGAGRQPAEFFAGMWRDIEREDHWQGEIWNRRKNGEVYPVWLTVSVYHGAAGEVLNYVGIETDISERHAAQESIRQLAYYDPLTGLPNRTLLQDRVEQALVAAEREGKQVALMFVDLDHFKTINDSLGHFAGDQLLTEVAHRLVACGRRMDTVARLGGDEFVVLLGETTLEGAGAVARKIIDSVAQPYQIEQHQLTVTPSMGISLYPQDGIDFESLLKHADTAMYRAKESGRNAYQFFASEMNVAALERLVLENSMRQALERGEFVLHYQPQIDVASGSIVGAEALIRWKHPEIGMVSPGRFIPVAEVSGLIGPIGEWVLREACRQNRAWQTDGLPPICIAVNISSVQFRGGNLEESVREVLAVTGLEPEWLELELTEGTVMSDANATVDTLHRLSAMGIRLAIDDFGTGYSSLSYLKRFPIDRLKIDQSFVRDIVTDPDDWAIASAVISMGHSLRLDVIAEGVEHAEQLEMLRRQGCDEVQGYYFSVPLPAAEFAELLRQQKFEIGV
jgi:diguanylate cyclase (GGDEF)-like protein/PAS domain S-box-containing protein